MTQFDMLAMGSPPGTDQDPRAGMLNMIIMFAVLGVMFYFLLIRPQQKQRKDQEKLLKNIKSGDRVLLSSGIFGMITNVKEKSFTVKIADNVKVEVAKSSVGTVLQKADDGESSGGSSN